MLGLLQKQMCKQVVDLEPEVVLQVVSAMQRFDEIEQAIVFGSRAMGNAKIGSDVDLAIKGRQVTNQTICQLYDYLNEQSLLPYFFDVLDVASVKNDALLKHIELKGILIYTR